MTVTVLFRNGSIAQEVTLERIRDIRQIPGVAVAFLLGDPEQGERFVYPYSNLIAYHVLPEAVEP